MNLSEEAKKWIFNHKFDLISLDATMGKNHSECYHMGLPDAVTFAALLEEKGCIHSDSIKVINHFSHNGNMSHKDLEEFAQKNGMIAAYDGMEISLS